MADEVSAPPFRQATRPHGHPILGQAQIQVPRHVLHPRGTQPFGVVEHPPTAVSSPAYVLVVTGANTEAAAPTGNGGVTAGTVTDCDKAGVEAMPPARPKTRYE